MDTNIHRTQTAQTNLHAPKRVGRVRRDGSKDSRSFANALEEGDEKENKEEDAPVQKVQTGSEDGVGNRIDVVG